MPFSVDLGGGGGSRNSAPCLGARECAERVVDRVRERVNPRRLSRTDDDSRLARVLAAKSFATAFTHFSGTRAGAGVGQFGNRVGSSACRERLQLLRDRDAGTRRSAPAGSRNRWSAIVPVTVYVDSTTYSRFIVSSASRPSAAGRTRGCTRPRRGRSRGSRCRARGCGRSWRSCTSRRSFCPNAISAPLQRLRRVDRLVGVPRRLRQRLLDVLADEPQRTATAPAP